MTPIIVNKLSRHLHVDLEESMKMPGAKLKFKFNEAGYRHQAYPKVKHHPTKGRTVVRSAEAERALGEGWYDTKAEFPESPIKEPTVPEKLELLETLGTLIASEAIEGEHLTDTLYRIISERNEFAIKLAGADQKKGKKDAKAD